MKVLIFFIIEKLKLILNLKVVFSISKKVDINDNFIIDTELGKSIKLNDIAINIINLLDGKNTVDDIVRLLLKKYRVEEEILKTDVNNLITNLSDKNLVEGRITGNKILVFIFDLFIGQYLYKKDIQYLGLK